LHVGTEGFPPDARSVCGDGEASKWMTAYMTGSENDMIHDGSMGMLQGDRGEDNTRAVVLKKADAEDPANWLESGPRLMRMQKGPALSGWLSLLAWTPPGV
jgi:hypothetical protein